MRDPLTLAPAGDPPPLKRIGTTIDGLPPNIKSRCELPRNARTLNGLTPDDRTILVSHELDIEDREEIIVVARVPTDSVDCGNEVTHRPAMA